MTTTEFNAYKSAHPEVAYELEERAAIVEEGCRVTRENAEEMAVKMMEKQ